MGFTKSHLFTHWWDPGRNKVKYAFAVCFEEYCIHMSESDMLLLCCMLLSGEMLPTNLLTCDIDLSDHTQFAFLPLLPKGQTIGLCLAFSTYHNLPCIVDCQLGSCFSAALSSHGSLPNYWILSIALEEPITPLVTLQLFLSLILILRSIQLYFQQNDLHPLACPLRKIE